MKHADILALAGQAHGLTEAAYRTHAATRGAPGWEEKQRILLADMAIHLLQTALKDGDLSVPDLRRNLFAILTVCDQFLPEAGLKANADGMLNDGPA